MDRLLTAREVAERLAVPERTLEAWRVRGSGPRYLRLPGGVRYDPRDLAAWLAARRRRSTSGEAPEAAP